jgi:phosphatidylserine/phosphatidylglycerophosphate/cardiolipin synthase-like enzyme
VLHLELHNLALSCGIDPFASDAAAKLALLIEQRGLATRIKQASHSPADTLRLILRTVSAVRSVPAHSSRMEFVATLPSGIASGTRPTSIVVQEICRSAARSLLLMGYQIRTTSGIDEHLKSAAARGVAVTLVCDRQDNGWQDVYRDWLPGTAKPKVLINPPRSESDVLGKMHCKVLCADAKDLMITSANFTWTGLNSNIEYGIRLSDSESGRQAVEFVQYLHREGLLVTPAV